MISEKAADVIHGDAKKSRKVVGRKEEEDGVLSLDVVFDTG